MYILLLPELEHWPGGFCALRYRFRGMAVGLAAFLRPLFKKKKFNLNFGLLCMLQFSYCIPHNNKKINELINLDLVKKT